MRIHRSPLDPTHKGHGNAEFCLFSLLLVWKKTLEHTVELSVSSVSSFGIPFQILTASFPYLKLVILCTWYGSFVCPDSTYTQRHGKEHTWWHHQMETFSALLALCEGNPLVDSPHKGSDAELWCFLWSVPEQTVEKTIERPVIWNAIALIRTSI